MKTIFEQILAPSPHRGEGVGGGVKCEKINHNSHYQIKDQWGDFMATNEKQTLIRAWMRLMYYDKITQDEKRNFMRLRRIIILLTLAVTVLSVVILLFDIISRDQNWVFALMAGVSAFLMFLYLIPTTFLKFIPFIFKVAIPSLFYSVIGKDKRRWLAQDTTRPDVGESFEQLQNNLTLTLLWLLRIFLLILIIVASLSMFAVVHVLMDSNATDLQNALGIIILSLPIIGLNVLNYTELYAGPTTWIQYRVAAEKIRSNIYLYRTKTDPDCKNEPKTDVADENPDTQTEKEYHYTIQNERDIKLASVLSQVSDEIPQKVPYTRTNGQAENVDDEIDADKAKLLIKPALEYSADGDDGLTDLDGDQFVTYIKTRIHKQIDWYRDRVEKDYLRSKRYTQYAMMITTVGSVLGIALSVIDPRLVGLVAIANAISVALTAWTNVTMIGKTYNIYNATWQRLDNTLTEWRAIENKLSDVEEGRHKFVAEIECILETELREWSKTAMEIQVSNDRSMRNNLAKEDIKSTGWYKELPNK